MRHQLPTHTCTRCSHTWVPRKPGRPGLCPNCNSAVWDQPRIRLVSKRTSEIVCPWCQATCPLTGDEARPFPFEGYGDFEAFPCACEALGSPSGDIGEAGWPLDEVEAALAGLLRVQRGKMETTINHVTHTNPPMLMLWGRKRKTPH